MGLPVPIEQIQQSILLIRGKKVMLENDPAKLYGVPTKRLNEQVKRNRDRFPEDFMFKLTAAEKTEVVAKCDHLAKLKYSSTHPYAFTEHGAIMFSIRPGQLRSVSLWSGLLLDSAK